MRCNGKAEVLCHVHVGAFFEARADFEIGVENEVFMRRRIVFEVVVHDRNGLQLLGIFVTTAPQRVRNGNCGCRYATIPVPVATTKYQQSANHGDSATDKPQQPVRR